MIGTRAGKGLFKLNMTPVPVETANTASATQDVGVSKSYLWHLRLGHIGHGGLDAVVKQKLGDGIDIGSVSKWELCNGCALGKQTRVSFQSTAPERGKDVHRTQRCVWSDEDGDVLGQALLRDVYR